MPVRAKPAAIDRQNDHANDHHGDAECLQWARHFAEEERRNQNREYRRQIAERSRNTWAHEPIARCRVGFPALQFTKLEMTTS